LSDWRSSQKCPISQENKTNVPLCVFIRTEDVDGSIFVSECLESFKTSLAIVKSSGSNVQVDCVSLAKIRKEGQLQFLKITGEFYLSQNEGTS
jgi:hypothetical protein